MTRSGALIIIAVLALAVGCDAAPLASGVGRANTLKPVASVLVSVPAPMIKMTSTVPDHEGPKVNWDAPLGDARSTSPSAAAQDGALTFVPRTPQFSIAPVKVQVTNPASTAPSDRAVAYVYKFPTGSDFPTDGRIRVLQYVASSTEADLEEVAANPPGPPENFAVVTIAGHRALLVQANGIGRIQFVQDDIMFDITGPAAPVAMVERLAAQL